MNLLIWGAGAIGGSIDEFVVKAPAFTPKTLTGMYPTILLCVKGQGMEDATRMLLPSLSAGGCVVSVQNGLNETTNIKFQINHNDRNSKSQMRI